MSNSDFRLMTAFASLYNESGVTTILRRASTLGRGADAAFSALGRDARSSLTRFNKYYLSLLGPNPPRNAVPFMRREASYLIAQLDRLPDSEQFMAAVEIERRIAAGTESLGDLSSSLARRLARARLQGRATTPEIARVTVRASQLGVNRMARLTAAVQSNLSVTARQRALVADWREFTRIVPLDDQTTHLEVFQTTAQLMLQANNPRGSWGALLNNVQGVAVGETYIKNTPLWQAILAKHVDEANEIAGIIGPGWGTEVIRGRSFLVEGGGEGFATREFADSIVAVAQKTARLGVVRSAFFKMRGEFKAEKNITALNQELRNVLRTIPDFGTRSPMLAYLADNRVQFLRIIPPPMNVPESRYAVALPGGRWPRADPGLPAGWDVDKIRLPENGLTRNGAARIANMLMQSAYQAINEGR